MELEYLIRALSNPAAYPHPVDKVEVCHTHISVIFLAGDYAYKLKKPLNLGFLDFTTLEKRRHFCEEEVRLNRRLAPTVYEDVVSVTSTPTGVGLEGKGPAIEWVVKMKRLPQDATLEHHLQRGAIKIEVLEALARKVSSFHAQAARGTRISNFGRFEVVARNMRENLEQAAPRVETTLSRIVYERLRTLTEASLASLHSLIENRAERDIPCDTHGDLHLDHVYYFPKQEPGSDLVIIDCIEFNERFRYADPIADMAFLVMDLLFHERRDLAHAFTEKYFQNSADREGRALLPFYTAYRAAVRGKVEGLKLGEPEIPDAERAAALAKARSLWLLALAALEVPGKRPCLVLVGGLPGTGKSTLARGLAEKAGFSLIRTDCVRKELAGLPSVQTSARSALNEGIYTPAWTERTYAACLQQTEQGLFQGERILVDATFGDDMKRQAFLHLAAQFRIPCFFFHCSAAPDVVRQRLNNRQGDASDADWTIHQQAAERWETPGPSTQHALREVATDGIAEEALAQALAPLREHDLLGASATISG